MGTLSRSNVWKCCFFFFKRGENWITRRKTSRSKDENQQQTQPTYGVETGNRTRATLGGRRMLSPLRPLSAPLPLPYLKVSRTLSQIKRDRFSSRFVTVIRRYRMLVSQEIGLKSKAESKSQIGPSMLSAMK